MKAPPTPRQKRLFERWAWLFPATYLLHVMEEYWGGEGFYRWITRIMGSGMTPTEFVAINAGAWLLMVASILLFRRTPSIRWLIISLGTVVMVNGLAHLAGSVWTGTYSPGVVSGTLLWIPLGLVTLYRGWHGATGRSFFSGVVVGLLIHALLFLVLLFGR